MFKINFSKSMDPPLIKKIAMYNSGIPGIPNYKRDIDRLLELNTESLRIDLSIGKKNCLGSNVVKGSIEHLEYDFSVLEELANMLNQKGVLPYYSWCYIPEALQKDGREISLNHDITQWEQVYREIHKKYASYFKEKNIHIGYHEVHNEPDLLGVFLAETFETYLRMYKAGSVGLKEGNEDAVIGGPALAIPEKNQNPRKFTDFVVEEGLPLDFFSFHVYWENDDYKHKLQCVRDALASHPQLNTVPIHINEFNYVGGWQGKDSINNDHRIIPHMFDLISEVLKTTDVILISWAQFMESTYRDDAYGIIDSDGHLKAGFNVLKIFADMPVDRVSIDGIADNDIGMLASRDENRACIVIWNRSDDDKDLELEFTGIRFPKGNMRVYRVDQYHSSFCDGADEELRVLEEYQINSMQMLGWKGNLSKKGAVYIVMEDGTCQEDFIQYKKCNFICKDIKINYFFEDRNKNNYQYFDRRTWKAYLGMGDNESALSLTGVVVEELPNELAFSFNKQGFFKEGQDSLLGLRIDYSVKGEYKKAVLIYDNLYSEIEVFPWGTGEKEDLAVIFPTLDDFKVCFKDYAPEGWDNDRVILSFIMKNTGESTKAEIVVKFVENIE